MSPEQMAKAGGFVMIRRLITVMARLIVRFIGPGGEAGIAGSRALAKVFIAAVAAAASTVLAPAAAQATTTSYRCFHVYAPYQSYSTLGDCRSGYVRVTLGGDTAQVLAVTNWQQTRTYALFNGFRLAGDRWTHRWGPWVARIGAGGFADPGRKIEGDALTPQGSYGFQFMFGVRANPGVHFRWRHAYRSDYWDDDPRSPRYNLWTDIRHHDAGRNPEPMHNVPAYDYAAVIAYNLTGLRPSPTSRARSG
jgi:hypothetical protein